MVRQMEKAVKRTSVAFTHDIILTHIANIISRLTTNSNKLLLITIKSKELFLTRTKF